MLNKGNFKKKQKNKQNKTNKTKKTTTGKLKFEVIKESECFRKNRMLTVSMESEMPNLISKCV